MKLTIPNLAQLADSMKQDLNDILIFTRVVDQGSFTNAAKLLEIPKSSISRAVNRLESSLQVRLLQRSTRKLNLTEIGKRYYDYCKRNIDELALSESIVENTRSKPTGTLKITAPFILGQAFFGPIIAEYLRTYSEADVNFLALNRRVNLIEEGVDLAFRAGGLADSSLISKKMGIAHTRLYANPSYLEKMGVPKEPDDLAIHHMLGYTLGQDANEWPLTSKEGQIQKIFIKPRFETGDAKSRADIAASGFGIAVLPTFVATPYLKSGDLECVLPEYYISEVPIHALYPTYRGLAPSVRAFIDIAENHLQKVLSI